MKDILIIGAGGAGLAAALFAKEKNRDIKIGVITKERPTRAQTAMAQGGINAPLNHNSDGDSVASHIKDTTKSAHGIASAEAIEKLCTNAQEAIAWLDTLGVPFNRDENSQIAQRQLGGASSSRACYAQDYTGLKILHTLYDACNKEGIEMLSHRFLLNLITQEESEGKKYVCGATFYNLLSGDIEAHYAKTVILATGGYSRIYQKHSTNSTASTGDGIAAALRAGATLSDMEFIQFHPTGLKNSSILISESARGAGGHILNSKGERFTDELLPRDMLSRAIHAEMLKGEEIFLDIRHLGEEFIGRELPQEQKLAQIYEGVDVAHELIPIKPVAHYTMGGIKVDATSQTDVKNLYAIGECANRGVHGANRLGGNSLLELIVFAKEAAHHACKTAQSMQTFDVTNEQVSRDIQTINEIMHQSNQVDFYSKQASLADEFYTLMGIVRAEPTMQKLLTSISKIKSEYNFMGVSDKKRQFNTNLCDFLEFQNMLTLAEVIALSALSRKESRGAHFREDATQERNDTFQAHTLASYVDKTLSITFEELS